MTFKLAEKGRLSPLDRLWKTAAVLLTITLVVAACGDAGGDATTTVGDTSTTGQTSTTAGSTTTESAQSPEEIYGPLEDEVVVTGWAQEWEFAIPLFEEKYGVKVVFSLQDSGSSAISKAIDSDGQIDIISVGVERQEQLVDAGIARPIDLSKITSYDELYPAVRENPNASYQGDVYIIPYYWGWTGLAYSNSVVTTPNDTWDPLFDEAYDGLIADYDADGLDNWAIASARLGFDINDVSDANKESATNMWLDQFKLVKTFWSSGDDIARLLSTGEVAVAPIWDGTGRTLILDGVDLTVYPPAEGARGWVDGPALLNGPNPNAAHAFIDFVLSPEIQAQMVKEYHFSPVSSGVEALVTEDEANLVNLSTANDSFAALQAENPEVRDSITEWWTEVRAQG